MSTYDQNANYTQDLKATIAKPSGDGVNWRLEVEPRNSAGDEIFTATDPGVVKIIGRNPADTQDNTVQVTDDGKLIVEASVSISGGATEAKQDTGNASLATIAGKDFATQTTLAAVLAKLTADPATQTTLAAILAKLIAAPATEAKQDSIISALGEKAAWSVVGTSAANTAQTVTKAAEAGKIHYVEAVEVVIKGASAGADITIELKDGSTVIWSTVIGSGETTGANKGIVFNHPLKLTTNTAANLVVSAGGASVVSVANIAGWTV